MDKALEPAVHSGRKRKTILIVVCIIVLLVFAFIRLQCSITPTKNRSPIITEVVEKGSIELVGEAMVLATLLLAVGSFFALQFPLRNVFDLPGITYIGALLRSVSFILLAGHRQCFLCRKAGCGHASRRCAK